MARGRIDTSANIDDIIRQLLAASYSKGTTNEAFGDTAKSITPDAADAYNQSNGLQEGDSGYMPSSAVFDKTGSLIGGKDLDIYNKAIKGGYANMPYKSPSYWQSLINPDTAHDVNKTNEEFALAPDRQAIADTAMQHANDVRNNATHGTLIAGIKALNPSISDEDANRQATIMRLSGGTSGDTGGFDVESTLTKPQTDYAYNAGTSPEGRAYASIRNATANNIMSDYGVQKAGGLLGGVDTENATEDNIQNTKLIASQYGLEQAPVAGSNDLFSERLKAASNLGYDLPTETKIAHNRQLIANTASRFGDTGSNSEHLFHVMPNGKGVDNVTNPTLPPSHQDVMQELLQDPEKLKNFLSGLQNAVGGSSDTTKSSAPTGAVQVGDKWVIPFTGN